MKFGATPLSEALGCVLAHTMRLPGRTIAKGSVLDGEALRRLAEASVTEVVAAQFEPGDVAEDAAAARLAAALVRADGGLICTAARTGRVNLVAAHDGLFRADASGIDAVNAVFEGMTVGTLADATPVVRGELVATVKIIPFAVAGAALAQAETVAQGAEALRLKPFVPWRVGLIVSVLPGLKESVLAGTISVTERRVRGLSGTMLPAVRVEHAVETIAAAVSGLLPHVDLVLIAGASAVMDRQDVAPAAILAAGGTIEHFGMPVDPGNLICIGRVGAVPALVLPGCARSPKLNGIDLVLRRLFAGEPVGAAEIVRMGVGGLLQEAASRPMPRVGPAVTVGGAVAAVVLAAGMSRRMGTRNKLLVPDRRGVAMIARVVDAVLASRARPVCVVVGHDGEAVRAVLAGRPVLVVEAVDHASGMAASLRAGLAGLPAGVGAALICLGDMPLVGAGILERLIEAYDPQAGALIVAPTSGGKRGNPVLWDRRFFGEMMRLEGDAGARSLLLRHAEAVVEIEVADVGVLLDFDTPEALEESASF